MTSRQGGDRQPARLLAAGRRRWPRSPGLPGPGERVAVVGCGTSWFMAKAYAALREQRRPGRDRRVPGLRVPARPPYDRVVAITRSGTTTEVIDLLGRRSTAGRRPRRSPPTRRQPAAALADATPWSLPTSPTSSRWCRPGSPPARSPCSGPTSARTSTALAADAEVAVRAAAAGRTRRWPSRSPSWAAAGPSGSPRRPR